MKTNTEITAIITALPARSAWSRGVKIYACELVEAATENGIELSSAGSLKLTLLNGASDWPAFSSGGCALIYDADICERLCSPSEIKKTRNGDRAPNARETWLDCQARALHQAANLIARAIRN
jgi:hypothetical protein